MVEIPNLNIELNEIPNLSYAKLRDLYFYLFNQYIKSTRREFFVWRITNRLQELRYGGLDSKTRRFLENMTEDDISCTPVQ